MPKRSSSSGKAALPTPGPSKPSYDLSPSAAVAAQRLGAPSVQQTAITESLINAAAIYLYRQARFTPISFLNPEVMTSQLSEWNVGTMRRFSLTMDAIEARDPLVKSVTGKLKMSLSRRGYEIVKVEGADEGEAEAHAQALEYFYANLEATNAVDRNQRGGFGTLVHQMMDAQLKKYAAHEIVWKPIGTDMLTASFVFVPLWFFENRTGSLRFAGNFAWDGIPLKEGQWMVTVGDGIMESVCVAWMYKTIALRDWLIYSERNGMPAPIGKTPHANGTPGWSALRDALQSIGTDSAILIGLQDEIDKLEFGGTGQLPYPPLVEYMDKVISAVARGADLSTLSSGKQSEGVGATLQGEESELIEQHNGQMITETLNHYVDPYVLQWHFGPETVPCAYVKLNIPKKKDMALEMQIDEFLVKYGARLGMAATLENYGRVEAQADEDALEQPAVAPPFGGGEPFGGDGNGKPQNGELEGAQERVAANAVPVSRVFLNRAKSELAKGTTGALKPLRERIASVLELANDDQFKDGLKKLRDDLPKLLRRINKSPANEIALRQIIGAMVLNGLTSGPNPAQHRELAHNEAPVLIISDGDGRRDEETALELANIRDRLNELQQMGAGKGFDLERFKSEVKESHDRLSRTIETLVARKPEAPPVIVPPPINVNVDVKGEGKRGMRFERDKDGKVVKSVPE